LSRIKRFRFQHDDIHTGRGAGLVPLAVHPEGGLASRNRVTLRILAAHPSLATNDEEKLRSDSLVEADESAGFQVHAPNLKLASSALNGRHHDADAPEARDGMAGGGVEAEEPHCHILDIPTLTEMSRRYWAQI
jgi:hypothetical protein